MKNRDSAKYQFLKNNQLENIPVLEQVEDILRSQRGYVFRIPQPGTPVIVLFSGGLDSVASTHILIEKYKLHIYPIFINRGQQRIIQELKAAKYYIKEIRSRYPLNCEQLYVINQTIPPRKLRYMIALHSNDKVKKNSEQVHGIPGYLLSLVAVGLQYARFLELEQKILSTNIFCNFILTDGKVMSYETLTALRAATLSVCVMQSDFSWQISSIALEKELNMYWQKKDLLLWCEKHHVDLTHTWSCYYPFIHHCGECIGCDTRKKGYKVAKIVDKTIYQKPGIVRQYIYKIQQSFYAKRSQFNF